MCVYIFRNFNKWVILHGFEFTFLAFLSVTYHNISCFHAEYIHAELKSCVV